MSTALFSVYDKTGLLEFAGRLHSAGWELLASGGTARALADAGLPVQTVETVTGEPEMLEGRVKTLHPAIHAGLLARDTDEDRAALAARGWLPIDLIAVNLYPFEEFIARPNVDMDTAIENIDIGGVALLRAAAKNHARVTVLCDPADYERALHPSDTAAFRLRMAHKAFARTAAYDAAIESYFALQSSEPAPLRLTYYTVSQLRYGENPHQDAVFYSPELDGSPLGGELLQGKPISYNNMLDLDAAWRAVASFAEPAVVVVKHNSPCGIASMPSVAKALALAVECDPISAFGSVIACNREVEAAFVDQLGDLFVECIVAPGFASEARAQLAARKNLRLLQMAATSLVEKYELRSIVGGLLRQDVDVGDPPDAPDWQVVSAREPTPAELSALQFAWRACQFVKSNAITLAQSEGEGCFTVGIGGGQPNRVDCVQIAGERAGEQARGAVLASDAFFPFPDGVTNAAELGITAVVQPGGSIRDEAIIAAADAAGLAMVFTGVRHFRH